ncbi:MAG: hypothetical protein ALECFALPRED_008336 [Alectoria fallacina]|uniref:Uncharacterized protein n=1 Tax=Alectoria fallacina TaxID=1903189 RepID=A0A8H3EUE1_9LECA|nr:MAG: hypothetical protein ALECFALPRED_008336 [Alectoria fallacina]
MRAATRLAALALSTSLAFGQLDVTAKDSNGLFSGTPSSYPIGRPFSIYQRMEFYFE